MTTSGSAGDGGALADRRARFDRWRRGRPFLGGALLILASFVIAWIPINIAPDTILIGETLSPVGLLFAALVFLCGIFALTRPQLADIFGIFGVVFSIFSLYGALGGFGIGLALGIIGGVLCYAWREDDEGDGQGGSGGSDANDASGFVFDEDSDEDAGGGLFGTRSVSARTRTENESTSANGAGGPTASLTMLVVTVVVLATFAHPFVVAAAGPFPDQTQIDGTIVVADQFSGQGYNHENVTTDTSNRDGVPAARQSFTSAQIQGMTIYKNFHTGDQSPYSIVISGSSSNAPDGLSLTASEFYASQLSFAGVVPLARNKWSTCPGQDFLLSQGDIIRPPIAGQDVTTNTHQLSANTVTIQDLNLTVQQGTQSTSVSGTPECTTGPVETVLDLFTANALNLLVDEGRLDPNVTSGSGVTNLDAPDEVEQGESFEVSATVTNTGYLEDEMTVQYGFGDDKSVQEQNVTLGPNESTTVTFTDNESSDRDGGTYDYAVAAGNSTAMGELTITEPAANQTANATANESAGQNETVSPASSNATTDDNGTANDTAAANATEPTSDSDATSQAPGTNATTTTTTSTETTPATESTPATASAESDTTPTESTTTESATAESTTTQTPTASADGNETSATQTPAASDSTATNSTATPESQSSLGVP